VKRLGELTSDEVAALVTAPPSCVLFPVGSVEPHGPHLPLATDTLISEAACARAADALEACGVGVVVAPSLPFGVTDYAAGFKGAIGVPAAALEAMLHAVVLRLLADGFSHVCLVNNHLEPAHDQAVRASVAGLPASVASVACPLTRLWARTLSDEFKRGNCHAGRYETSLVLAAGGAVKPEYATLAGSDISLADGIKAGKATFREMGMDRAYTGAPAEATAEEGRALYDKLADMIVGEVTAALGLAAKA
jgi:creatinine amidohydrolase